MKRLVLLVLLLLVSVTGGISAQSAPDTIIFTWSRNPESLFVDFASTTTASYAMAPIYNGLVGKDIAGNDIPELAAHLYRRFKPNLPAPEALFTEDSAVFETGGVEGTYKEDLAHHLGPGLAAFPSFAFSDYTVAVRMAGDLELATENYNYRIETKSGEIAVRKGVATSVLIRSADGWKILVMHNSARKRKGA